MLPQCCFDNLNFRNLTCQCKKYNAPPSDEPACPGCDVHVQETLEHNLHANKQLSLAFDCGRQISSPLKKKEA